MSEFCDYDKVATNTNYMQVKQIDCIILRKQKLQK